jgi:hypothetical protein
VFDEDLVGGRVQSETKKWIDDWTHEGRMVWTGNLFATYFGHTSNRINGKHQGDLLWLFDGNGKQVSGDSVGQLDWDWGCSHSLDVRLAYDQPGDRIGSACLSDCHPGKGIFFDRSYLISSEPSGNCVGHSDASLGGLVPAEDGFVVSYASNVGRKSLDIALVRMYNDGFIGSPQFLTETPKVQEAAPHLARYGDNLLAGWKDGSALKVAVVTEGGKVLEGPVAITANVGERDDFVNYPNGDIGWAYTVGGKLSVARIQACE